MLLSVLDGICKEKRRLYQLGHKSLPSEVTISIEEFENKARQLHTHDIQPFLQSTLFTNHRYELDPTRGLIVKKY
jgi:DNA replication licensing factor MCM2